MCVFNAPNKLPNHNIHRDIKLICYACISCAPEKAPEFGRFSTLATALPGIPALHLLRSAILGLNLLLPGLHLPLSVLDLLLPASLASTSCSLPSSYCSLPSQASSYREGCKAVQEQRLRQLLELHYNDTMQAASQRRCSGPG